MRGEIADDPEYIKRFHREARAVAKLSHPHIVQIYGAGEEEGVFYFVMEWVNGRTLGAIIREHGQVPPKDALRIIKQAADALGYASAQGVIHRDIKPGNIMLDATGAVKIADFGLAKLQDGQTCMTQTGVCLGSPNYMSPEACRGEELDHRSDQYSLGVTFYEMLKGELPYSAPTPMSVMFKHVHDPLPEPAALRAMDNGIWLNVLQRMTAKDPEQRFQSYDELREALSAVESASNGSLNSITPIRPTSTALYGGATASAPGQFSGTSILATGLPDHQRQTAVPIAGTAGSRDYKKLGLYGGGGLLAVGALAAGIFWAMDFFGGSGAPAPVQKPSAVVATEATPTPVPTVVTQVAPAQGMPPEQQGIRPEAMVFYDSQGVRIPKPEESRAEQVPFALQQASPTC
jgi:serine/threonine-protein kinase